MTWVRLDDGFADHPKIERVGPLAAWLHVAALCYCSRHLTDGRVPKTKARRLADIPNPDGHVSALLAEGVWHEDGADYVLHDYLDYQPSKAQVETERSAARERMSKKRQEHRSADVRANTNGTNGRSSPSPSRPVPNETVLTSSLATHERALRVVDDDELSTGVPEETWKHYAELKLSQEPPGKVRNTTSWKATTQHNAAFEHGETADRWWRMFELTPRRLAECLIDGQPPRNANRRSA